MERPTLSAEMAGKLLAVLAESGGNTEEKKHGA